MKPILRRDPALLCVGAGLLLELIGLGLDAYLHQQDATLAAREGVFTLANPGHLLFVGGLALTVLGGGLHLARRWLGANRLGAALVGALALAGGLGAGGVAQALPDPNPAHAHHGLGGMITVSQANEINVSWEQLQTIDRMLGEAKAATAPFADVDAAQAAGYHQEGPSRRGEGAHFVNRQILEAGVFDPARPTILLYEHRPGTEYTLVGVSWLLPKQFGDDTPPPYFAPLAVWHYHDYPAPGICYWGDGTTNRFAEADCLGRGGRFWRQSPWMLHAWIFRPSPEGVFSLVNSAVDGILIDEEFAR